MQSGNGADGGTVGGDGGTASLNYTLSSRSQYWLWFIWLQANGNSIGLVFLANVQSPVLMSRLNLLQC